MIPRRPLLLITAVVLALHALVLGGTAPHWTSSPAEDPLRFTTRTVALPPPPPPPPPAVAAQPAETAPRPVARRKPRPRPAPANPGDTLPAASPLFPSPPAEPELPAAPESAPDDATAVAAAPPASEAAPPASAASAPASTDTPAVQGIAITPPGTAESEGSAQAPAVRVPAPARLGFDVTGQSKGFQYSARAELLWQHDGQQYQARQEISVLFLGSRTQTSVGEITARGLQPRRFGDRSRSEQAAHFDFAQGRATFSANTPAAAIVPGTQDRLSVFLQLGAMLSAAPQRFPVGTRISIPTVSARSADTWTFTVEGEETLELPVGTLRAVQFQRLPRRDYDQKAQVWLVPELDYLPARIRITQANGDFAELNLRARAQP